MCISHGWKTTVGVGHPMFSALTSLAVGGGLRRFGVQENRPKIECNMSVQKQGSVEFHKLRWNSLLKSKKRSSDTTTALMARSVKRRNSSVFLPARILHFRFFFGFGGDLLGKKIISPFLNRKMRKFYVPSVMVPRRRRFGHRS